MILRLCNPIVLGCVAAIVCSCTRDVPVELRVDFDAQTPVHYRVDATIDAQILHGKSSDHRSLLLSGVLSGVASPQDPATARLTLSDVGLEGNLVSEAQRNHLVKVLCAETLAINFVHGIITPPESAVGIVDAAMEWDFYRLLAKGLPSLPAAKVKPGFTWERDYRAPRTTRYGTAVGHSYQRCRLDSVSITHDDSLAFLSWEFSLTIDPRDSAEAILDSLPLRGKGQGSAVVNLGRNCFSSLHVAFQLTPDSTRVPTVAWKERVSLEMLP